MIHDDREENVESVENDRIKMMMMMMMMMMIE
jgi:hypothetical protein